MRVVLPDWLKNKIRDAVSIILTKTPEVSDKATKTLRAVEVNSTSMHTCFKLLVNSAMNSYGRENFTHEDKQLFGEILIELSTPDYNSVLDPEGRSVTKRIRFTPSEVEQIEADAQSQGVTFSQYVRSKLLL
ncbi:MAG: hypothetical protein ABFD64_02960 [Armatimonadota bacterium]